MGGPEPGSFATSKFVKWFLVFDEQTIRPFMIRNYNIQNIVMQEAYNDMITANFDDKNLLEVSARLDAFQETTRKMSSNNSLII